MGNNSRAWFSSAVCDFNRTFLGDGVSLTGSALGTRLAEARGLLNAAGRFPGVAFAFSGEENRDAFDKGEMLDLAGSLIAI